MALSTLFFWTRKTPRDNEWRPATGANPTKPAISRLPQWIERQDLAATCVDVAPFVAGAGALAHLRQLNAFGFDAHANIFRNPKTLLALHRATLLLTPVVLMCQAAGVEYRNLIPRWCHDRERRREEEEVRMHVDVGMYAGAAVWFFRMYGLRRGRTYWAPMDVIMGGAFTDLLQREFNKAHGL